MATWVLNKCLRGRRIKFIAPKDYSAKTNWNWKTTWSAALVGLSSQCLIQKDHQSQQTLLSNHVVTQLFWSSLTTLKPLMRRRATLECSEWATPILRFRQQRRSSQTEPRIQSPCLWARTQMLSCTIQPDPTSSTWEPTDSKCSTRSKELGSQKRCSWSQEKLTSSRYSRPRCRIHMRTVVEGFPPAIWGQVRTAPKRTWRFPITLMESQWRCLTLTRLASFSTN